MNNEFIPYEQALQLKELKFNEECIYHYKLSLDKLKHSKIATFEMATPFGKNHNILPTRISAPLYQQAFKFFRERYGLYFRPDYYDELKEYDFQGSIHELGKYSALINIDNHKTYEETQLACLEQLIKIANERTNRKTV